MKSLTNNFFLYRLANWSVTRTAMASAGASVMRLLVSLVTMPALLNYLGVEGLGTWLIALSLLGLIGFLNNGMSSAVVTAIGRLASCSTHLTAEARRSVNTIASSAMALSLLIGAAILFIMLPIALAVDWQSLLQIDTQIENSSVTSLMTMLTLCLALGFIARLPKFILLGLRRGCVAHLIEIFAIIFSGIALLTAINFEYPLHVMAAIFILVQYLIMAGIGGAVLFTSEIRFWSFRTAERATIGHLAREGSKLAVNQASFSVATQSDLLLIGAISGAAESSSYGILQRLFSLPVLMSSVVNEALWPVMTRADALDNKKWMRQTFLKTLLVLVVATTLLSGALGIFISPIVKLWLGQDLAIDWLLVSGMIVWGILTAVTGTAGMLLRSMGRTTFLSTTMTFMMAANLPISIFLIHKLGAAGAIWGTVIAYTLCLLAPYCLYLPRLLKPVATRAFP